jgi:hypothetical protein
VSLLGDVVGSRRAPDRVALHARLREVLTAVDAEVDSDPALAVTVGDEFQGRYPTLGSALDAALRVRLALLPAVDVRIGLGRGPVVDLETGTGLQDGPGWWAAREAVEAIEASARGGGLKSLRTAYRESTPERAGTQDAVNAALACQDQLVGSLSERGLRLLAGLLAGATQAELAAREGISPSAVSQQVRTQGIGAILHAHGMLRRLP